MPNKLTIEDVRIYLLQKDKNVKLLSKEYINQNIPLKFQCSCGSIFERKWIDLHSQKYVTCRNCSIKKRGKTKRIGLEEARKEFEEKGYVLLEDEYIGNNVPMLCQDSVGYMGKISLSKIRKNCNIEKFSQSARKEFLVHNLNVWAELQEIDTKILELSKNQKWSRQGIICKCDCGNIYETSFISFLYGKFRCNDCTNRVSTYEKEVENWLKQNQINYKSQYKIKDCRNILPLPFDFYLPQQNCLIEIDGEGHFGPTYFNNCSKEKAELAYEATHKNDLIKNQYCQDNNIKLYRIPYWDIQNQNYLEILTKIIKN